MRRYLSAVCILFSLLSSLTHAQLVTGGTSFTTEDAVNTSTIVPATFTTPGKVNTLIPLSGGRMLIGGSFVTLGGQATPRSLAIIQSDGSLDTTFQVDQNL